jgi:hypothetical protein
MQISSSKVSRFLQTLAVEDAGILFRGEGDITYVATILARAGMSLKTVEHWMRAVIWRRWSLPMTNAAFVKPRM